MCYDTGFVEKSEYLYLKSELNGLSKMDSAFCECTFPKNNSKSIVTIEPK